MDLATGQARVQAVLDCPGLLSFWDFQEEAGEERVAQGLHPYRLREMAGPVERAEEGVFGPYAADIAFGQWFSIPRAACPALDLHGPDAQITVAAWLRRGESGYKGCEAVAGQWDESRAMRQAACS